MGLGLRSAEILIRAEAQGSGVNKYLRQAEATRAASAPKEAYSDSPHRILARRMLDQWAKEVNEGGGAPNILAVFERLGDGDPVFHISPGPIFTPMSQRTERILRDIRNHDPRTAALLMATALEYSHQQIANAEGSNKSRVQDDLREAYGAFSMSFHYITRVLKMTPEKNPRKIRADDIGI